MQKICTLSTIRVKKQHNKELRHIIEMLSMVIKDLLMHKCPLLTAVTNCLRFCRSGLSWKVTKYHAHILLLTVSDYELFECPSYFSICE